METRSLPVPTPPKAAPFIDERHVMWTHGKDLWEVDLATGTTRTHPSRSKGASSPQQQAMGVGAFLEWGLGRKARAKLWMAKKGKLVSRSVEVGHEAPICAGTFVDEAIVTGDEAGAIVVSDGREVRERFVVPHEAHGRIRALWPLADERLLVAGGDDGVPRRRGALATYSLEGERLVRHGELFVGTAKCFALRGDRWLAVGFAVGDRVQVIDLEAGTARTLEVPEADVATLTFSADGSLLFAATKGGWSWTLLDVASGAVRESGGSLTRRGTAALHAPSGQVVEWRDGALRTKGEALVECATPRALASGGGRVVAATDGGLLVVE